jgi:hypothetical protein
VQSLLTICTELLDAVTAMQSLPVAPDGSLGAHSGRKSGLAFSPTHQLNLVLHPTDMPDVQNVSAMAMPENTCTGNRLNKNLVVGS